MAPSYPGGATLAIRGFGGLWYNAPQEGGETMKSFNEFRATINLDEISRVPTGTLVKTELTEDQEYAIGALAFDMSMALLGKYHEWLSAQGN